VATQLEKQAIPVPFFVVTTMGPLPDIGPEYPMKGFRMFQLEEEQWNFPPENEHPVAEIDTAFTPLSVR